MVALWVPPASCAVLPDGPYLFGIRLKILSESLAADRNSVIDSIAKPASSRNSTIRTEIAILDRDERSRRAIRRRGNCFHPASQIVRVRLDGQHLHVHRQHVAIGDHVLAFAQRNVDGLPPKPEPDGSSSRSSSLKNNPTLI